MLNICTIDSVFDVDILTLTATYIGLANRVII